MKKLQEGNRNVPDQVKKIGRVLITYQSGCNGLRGVQYMSQFGFDRLSELVGAFAGLVSVRAELEARPERAVRKQAAKILGLKGPAPLEETKPDPYEFNIYTVTGFRKKRAKLTSRTATLIPMNIKEVKFLDVIDVEN